jgi:uncharacterized FAD-dependent dehydrogenase
VRTEEYWADICILGLGPAGIGAAVTLARMGIPASVICIDAGMGLEERDCSVMKGTDCVQDRPCRVISGFGGSSLLGGGKLSLLPAGKGLVEVVGSHDIADNGMRKSLALLRQYIDVRIPVLATADVTSARQYYGALGFDYRYYENCLVDPEGLRKVYNVFLRTMYQSRFQVLFETSVYAIERRRKGFTMYARMQDRQIAIRIDGAVLVGTGRLGVQLLKKVGEDLSLSYEEGELDIGVRIEFPTDVFPDLDRYHTDLKLLFGDARTFCVCKDGKVVTYLFGGTGFTEGYRDYLRPTGFSNLAITLRLTPPESTEMWRAMVGTGTFASRTRPVIQSLADLETETPTESSRRVETTLGCCRPGTVMSCFPRSIWPRLRSSLRRFADAFLPRAAWDSVGILAPEMGVQYPRFALNRDFSISPGLYLIGDAAGHFRGILQAFCSGVLCAEGLTSAL